MKRAITATIIIVAAAVLFTGCSASGGSQDASSAVGGPAMSAPDAAIPGVAVQEDGKPDGTASGGLVATDQVAGDQKDQSVVTTGSLSVTSDDPVDAARRTVDLVTAASGRVDSRSEQPGSDTQPASATLVVRIPADRFEAVAAKIADLGDVADYNTNSTDVTSTKKDLDARIDALKASVDRLITLMAGADTTADLIAIESSLSQRQADLESLTSQRDALADQIDYSTLSVQFFAPGIAPVAGPNSFWDGLVAGWNTLIAFLAGTLVVIGVFLPWLALLAIIAAVVLLIVRLSTRGRRGSGRPPTAQQTTTQQQPPTVEDARVG